MFSTGRRGPQTLKPYTLKTPIFLKAVVLLTRLLAGPVPQDALDIGSKMALSVPRADVAA